ncbi:HEAT repeat domain-containing protein, partial [Singulisphaera rosea]
MSSDPDETSSPRAEEPKPVRRHRSGVRTMIVMVACCAAILWAWRYGSENYDLASVEARLDQKRILGSIQSKTPDERVAAIQELARVRHGDISVSVPPVIGALGDPEQVVRIAAVQTLGAIDASEMSTSTGKEAGQ